jgi:hypothetical protein
MDKPEKPKKARKPRAKKQPTQKQSQTQRVKQTVNIKIGDLAPKTKRRYTRRPKGSQQSGERQPEFNPVFAPQVYPFSYNPPVYKATASTEPSPPPRAPTAGALPVMESAPVPFAARTPTLTSTDEPVRIVASVPDPTPYVGAISAAFIPSEAPDIASGMSSIMSMPMTEIERSSAPSSAGSIGTAVERAFEIPRSSRPMLTATSGTEVFKPTTYKQPILPEDEPAPAPMYGGFAEMKTTVPRRVREAVSGGMMEMPSRELVIQPTKYDKRYKITRETNPIRIATIPEPKGIRPAISLSSDIQVFRPTTYTEPISVVQDEGPRLRGFVMKPEKPIIIEPKEKTTKPVVARQRNQYRPPAAKKSFQSYPFPAPSYGDSSLRTPRVSFEPTTVSLPTEQYPIESRVKPKSGSAEYQRQYRARKKAEKEAMNPPEARVVKLKPRRTTQARRGRYVSGSESEAP